MELNLFFLAPLLQYTSIDRCALFMRTKQKKYYFTPLFIKIIFLFSFLFSSHFTAHLSLSLSLSHTLRPFALSGQSSSLSHLTDQVLPLPPLVTPLPPQVTPLPPPLNPSCWVLHAADPPPYATNPSRPVLHLIAHPTQIQAPLPTRASSPIQAPSSIQAPLPTQASSLTQAISPNMYEFRLLCGCLGYRWVCA